MITIFLDKAKMIIQDNKAFIVYYKSILELVNYKYTIKEDVTNSIMDFLITNTLDIGGCRLYCQEGEEVMSGNEIVFSGHENPVKDTNAQLVARNHEIYLDFDILGNSISIKGHNQTTRGYNV